ncbi:MAG: hypothetical protein AAGD11_04190 [Planctomycetota bacterium]
MNQEAKQGRASNLAKLAALCCCLPIVGCGGSSSPYAMVKASGQVLYEDGSPIPAESIMIRFDSQESAIDAKTHARPGMATAGADGKFGEVTTSKYADGIVRGKHKVQLSAADAQGKPLIPVIYGSAQTPIEVDSSETPFEFRVPRP